ncbi:hypothetical protein F1880_003636 [Penicillium rolfsii]|nr:hypothetical protein F1880_003636 [Penicillium rolfsii]
MSATKEFTLQEVASHNTKKDLYMIIHDKVYDCTSFVDEHPYVSPLLQNTSQHSPPACADANQAIRQYTPITLASLRISRFFAIVLLHEPIDGGEEVLLDVGGQDGSEAFEDVGHSDEAREILDGLLVGSVKRLPGDPAPKAHASTGSSSSSSSSSSGSFGVGLYAVILIGGAIAYGAYNYLQSQQSAQ